MDKEEDINKKSNIAMEKARLKAEYKKIMNERQLNSGRGFGKEEGKGKTILLHHHHHHHHRVYQTIQQKGRENQCQTTRI